MATETDRLEALRAEIDLIDDQIHDLLMRRTDVVQAIAKIKNSGAGEKQLVPSLAWRPEREARILRRLAKRHRGDLPFGLVLRLWRELVAATTGLQGPFSIALPRTADPLTHLELWSLARAYYGDDTPIEVLEDAHAVLEAVVRRAGVIGVLPAVPADDADPWWPDLTAFEGINELGLSGPRVIARLPFLVREASAPPAAFTIACLAPGATGEDTSLLLVETGPDVRAQEVELGLGGVGLSGRVIAAHAGAGASWLVAVDGYVEGPVTVRAPLSSATLVGVYANPLVDPTAR